VWEGVDLPYIFERMLEFSIPNEDQMLIVSYDGAHHLKLLPTVEVTHYPEHREGEDLHYDGDRVLFGGVRFKMVAMDEDPPITHDTRRGHHLSLDLPGEKLFVIDDEGRLVQEIAFVDLSGDWGFATYSEDGRWLAIGVPYDVFLFRWQDDPPTR
jgi:hypothetical protein